MPNIDMNEYNAAEETSGGGRGQMVPGAYIATVQAIRTEGKTLSGSWTSDEKQYVIVVFDIADGPFAGEFSRDWYMKGGRIDPDKDYLHRDYLSWKNLGFLKRKLRAFSESNPGFDAEAAFFADKWEMFIGKRFGVVLDGEVSTSESGYDRWRFSVGEVASVQAVRDGKVREPRITDNRVQVATADAYDDVPFV